MISRGPNTEGKTLGDKTETVQAESKVPRTQTGQAKEANRREGNKDKSGQDRGHKQGTAETNQAIAEAGKHKQQYQHRPEQNTIFKIRQEFQRKKY